MRWHVQYLYQLFTKFPRQLSAFFQHVHVTIFTVLFILASSALVHCTSGTPPPPPTKDTLVIKDTQTGLASYYGHAFDGKKTANGETFNSREMVAAHPSYPLGTIARITNLEKGDTVQVRIIDRGPTKENTDEGVIIDLSKGAAEKLGMIKEGRIRVKVEVLQWGTNEYKAKDSL